MKAIFSFFLFSVLFLAIILLPDPVASQNCNSCAQHECCSKFGYCDTTRDYCGKDCRRGPCSLPAPNNNADVPGIVTNAFFNGIVAKSASNCPGRNFYTRDVFLRVIRDYPHFGRSGSIQDSKREIAAFFAPVTHETDHFCYIEERGGRSKNYCDGTKQKDYPCISNKGYYGRGPIQLSYNYNYGEAGKNLGFDGLRNPEIVATDQVVSFKTAVWFWMEHAHWDFASGNGFGATILVVWIYAYNSTGPTPPESPSPSPPLPSPFNQHMISPSPHLAFSITNRDIHGKEILIASAEEIDIGSAEICVVFQTATNYCYESNFVRSITHLAYSKELLL